MFLEVPSKLEQYIGDIKNQTKNIGNTNQLLLLRVGTSIHSDNKKTMFLIYNPFAIDIHIDCNFFTNKSCVYKLYPSEFCLKPDTAHAFIAFTSNIDSTVEIDVQKYILHLRHKIMKRLNKLNGVESQYGYKNTNVYVIDEVDQELEDTVCLNDIINEYSNLIDSQKFDNSNLDIIIKDMSEVHENYKLSLSITNNDVVNNLVIKGYNLKVMDDEHIAIIPIKQQLIVKCNSMKQINISFSKNRLTNFDMSKIKIKIVFI